MHPKKKRGSKSVLGRRDNKNMISGTPQASGPGEATATGELEKNDADVAAAARLDMSALSVRIISPVRRVPGPL